MGKKVLVGYGVDVDAVAGWYYISYETQIVLQNAEHQTGSTQRTVQQPIRSISRVAFSEPRWELTDC